MEWQQAIDRELFVSLWGSKLSNAELCARFGVNPMQLWSLKNYFDLPSRREAAELMNDPTPDEIARECELVRLSWSEEEEEKRRVGYRRKRWEPYYV